MRHRSRIMTAALLGLGLGSTMAAKAGEPALPAQPLEPGRMALVAPSANQATADAIAERLSRTGSLQHYHIQVSVLNGAVELTGSVANAAQQQQAVAVARATPGVSSVEDRLTTNSSAPIVQVQVPMPGALAPSSAQPVGPGGKPPGAMPAPRGEFTAGAPLPEPVPVFQPQAQNPYDLNPPPMPPYAWPTYAPHNNFSRVAYPQAYPYQAFPFIGPCYPFPKIPPGWRAVKLEWEDGYWWFSKTATKHDWWRLRYW